MPIVRLVPLLALLFPIAAACAQTVDFNAPGTYLAGAQCTAMADFNGDGKLDLVGVYDNQFTILLGGGNGTFQTLSPVVVGNGAACVAAGDFNGDGIPDLAIPGGSGTASVVTIFLGIGDGSFQAPRDYPVGKEPTFAAVADFNGDGRLDLAVVNRYSNTLSILLGNGDGTFQGAVFYATEQYPTCVIARDFNADGKLDLAVTNNGSKSVSILLGNGDGSFRKGKAYAVETEPASVAAADLNADGKLDLAVTNSASNNISILLGNGDGSFQPQVVYATGIAPESVAIGDLNGDGIPDLAVANGNYNLSPFSGLAILAGNGDGTFQQATHYQPGGYSVLIADFNGDGRQDLEVGDSYHLTILTNKGGGVFEQPTNFAVSDYPDAMAVADFNGDGRPDIAVANWNSANVSVLLNAGGGVFQPAVTYGVLRMPSSIAVGDFNGDGKPDMAVTNWGSNVVTILLGRGDGTFAKGVNYAVGNGPESVAVGDFNGDGKLDLAIANFGQIRGHQETGSVSILLGKGDGAFQPQATYLSDNRPIFVAVADFNGDGLLDVAAFIGKVVMLMPGKGDGTFGAPVSSVMGSLFDFVSPPAVADFNGDGIPDLTYGGYIALGNGDGTFRPAQFLGTSGQAVPGDFNGDGKIDLAQGGSEGVAIFTGNGDGTFNAPFSFLAGTDSLGPVDGYTNAWYVAVADFNRDGKTDVAVANWYSANVTVLTNVTK